MAVTRLSLYGGIAPVLPVAAAVVEPVATPSGPHSPGGRWVQPNRRTLRAEDRRWREAERVTREPEPSRECAKPEVRAVAPEPASPRVTPASGEDELLLQALVLLGLVE